VEIITSRDHLLDWRSTLNKKKKGLTFVPTMGALHQGHLSLIHKAEISGQEILASIFINPLQFNSEQDLKGYPKTPDLDLALLRQTACNAVYMPHYDDVYAEAIPHGFDFGALESALEGSFRPGHFQGVAKVLFRLFSDILPQEVILGLKDYQQFLVVKELGRRFFPEIKVEGAPTLRDAQGLAMSSRNQRLSPQEYSQAVKVANALGFAVQARNNKSFADWKNEIYQICSSLPDISVEYLELAHAADLTLFTDWPSNRQAIVLMAFHAGQTRLIDNVILPPM